MGGTQYLFTHFHFVPGVNTAANQRGTPGNLQGQCVILRTAIGLLTLR